MTGGDIMDANLMIRDFRKKMKGVIEGSGLPSGVCLYVVKDVVRELEEIYGEYCQSAMLKEKEGEKNDG